MVLRVDGSGRLIDDKDIVELRYLGRSANAGTKSHADLRGWSLRPYAHNLNKVLEVMEGHFIRGYGDTQKPDVEVHLLTGAVAAADAFLSENTLSQDRLECVSHLIEGFETPYGMELLSSAHWMAVHSDPAAQNPDEAVLAVQGWNARKQRMFRPEHIRVAWKRLSDLGWLSKKGRLSC